MTRDDETLRAGERGMDGVDSLMRSNLEAYHDRELSWWRRRLMEGRVRRSPRLQRELELLQEMSAAALSVDAAVASPDLWDDISGRLGAIDADRQSHRASAAAPAREPFGSLSALFGWKPMGLAVAAGATALAIGLWNSSGTVAADPNDGVLRYLDTGGQSVIVVDDPDVTIIWLI
jgi:hypothetical protein